VTKITRELADSNDVGLIVFGLKAENGGADGHLTKSIRKPGRNPKTIHYYRFARLRTHRAEDFGGAFPMYGDDM
jgi:hypothetical protein